MKIAIIYSAYRADIPSGENTAVQMQAQALQDLGHSVELISKQSPIDQPYQFQVKSAFRVATGYGASPREALNSFKPDLIHVHNLFPNWGTKWIPKTETPIVATFHNYRNWCANGLLMRANKACTECLSSSVASIRHACYRQSRLATLPLAISTRSIGKSNPLLSQAAQFIALSDYMREQLIYIGLPENRISTLGNFSTPFQGHSSNLASKSGWLYAGRLDASKGLVRLIQEWPENQILRIAGTGPLESWISSLDRKEILFLGRLDEEALHDAMQETFGVIIPSIWREGLPLVYCEALANGAPVITTQFTDFSSEVERHDIGFVLSKNYDRAEISHGLEQVIANYESISKSSQKLHSTKYSRETWQSKIIEIYERVLSGEGEVTK